MDLKLHNPPPYTQNLRCVRFPHSPGSKPAEQKTSEFPVSRLQTSNDSGPLASVSQSEVEGAWPPPCIKALAGRRLPSLTAKLHEPICVPFTRCYMTHPLYGPTNMCYACEPRLSALKKPTVPRRPPPTGPQYFTFDPLPEPEVEQSSGAKKYSRTSRIKKRSRRVLYPPVVKRYYPAEERSYAKRLLFILLTVIFVQVYSAEEDLPLLVEEDLPGCFGEGLRGSHCELPLEQPLNATPSLEIPEVANATDWPWSAEEASESTVDITQFWEQSPASF